MGVSRRAAGLVVFFLAVGMADAAEKAPDFNLKSPEGKRINLKELLKDGPVLLDFWATWCKPCIKAMPKLQAIYDKYKDRGFTVVGVNEDGPRGQAKVKPFLRARKLTFPVVMDLDRGLMKRMRAVSLPVTLLIDQDGEIVLRQSGYTKGKGQERALIEAIESLLPPEGETGKGSSL